VDEAGRVMRAAFDRGLLVGRKGLYKQVISLYPPLILSKEESNKALEILEEAITEAEKSK
jgi:4-aminobutyrate aminotransferase-like enzyme